MINWQRGGNRIRCSCGRPLSDEDLVYYVAKGRCLELTKSSKYAIISQFGYCVATDISYNRTIKITKCALGYRLKYRGRKYNCNDFDSIPDSVADMFSHGVHFLENISVGWEE